MSFFQYITTYSHKWMDKTPYHVAGGSVDDAAAANYNGRCGALVAGE